MARKIKINKAKLLERLEAVEYKEGEDIDITLLEKTNLSGALLHLAEIDQEGEYRLCRSIANHLLEEVPEPDDIDLEE
jgi:hypothetical protein